MMNETNSSKATETETPITDRTEETTMAKAIGLWTDSTGSTPVWIVSLDTLDADGNAEHSKTIRVYDDSEMGDTDDAEHEASEFALAEAARLELPCIQTERDGSRKTISE